MPSAAWYNGWFSVLLLLHVLWLELTQDARMRLVTLYCCCSDSMPLLLPQVCWLGKPSDPWVPACQLAHTSH
jgi:hypothetical protein